MLLSHAAFRLCLGLSVCYLWVHSNLPQSPFPHLRNRKNKGNYHYCDKYSDKNGMGEERAHSLYNSRSYYNMSGKGKNCSEGLRETNGSLLAHGFLHSYTVQGLAPKWHCPHSPWVFHPAQSRPLNISMATGQPGLGKFLFVVSSPVILGCSKLTFKT